jgi:hypothetical protein
MPRKDLNTDYRIQSLREETKTNNISKIAVGGQSSIAHGPLKLEIHALLCQGEGLYMF